MPSWLVLRLMLSQPPGARLLLGRIHELSRNPAAPSFGHHEHVLDLGNTQVCADPSDVRVRDGLIIVPCDEVGRAFRTLLVETAKRQVSIDVSNLAWL